MELTENFMARAIILVVDGFGIGSAPDADKFNDIGANTFAHIAQTYFDAKQKKLASMGHAVRKFMKDKH